MISHDPFKTTELEAILSAKEQIILQQAQDLQSMSTALDAKDQVIAAQQRTLALYGKICAPVLPILYAYATWSDRLRPRLGNLKQYPARPRTTKSPRAIKEGVQYPKISIVTPSFGQGQYIEETIRSVLNQGYPNLEYFIQDAASQDSTVSTLQKYDQQLSGWRSAKDNGQSHAINLAFARTKGDIMGWLNADDLLLPDTLLTVAEYFDQNPHIDVVYGNRLQIDSDSMEIGRWLLPGHDNHVLSWADYVPQETLFWRRSIWEKSGGTIDESFNFAMDWDLLIRFREAGAKFAHIPLFLGAFRVHPEQKTSAHIHDMGQKEMARIRLRVLGHIPNGNEIDRALRFFLFKHIVVDIAYRLRRTLSRI